MIPLTTILARATSPIREKPIIIPFVNAKNGPHELDLNKSPPAASSRPAAEMPASIPIRFVHGLRLYRILLANKPAIIGTMVISRIESIITIKSMGTSFPASVFIRKGVMTGDRRVEQDVMV